MTTENPFSPEYLPEGYAAPQPEAVFYGTVDAMVAEIGALDPRSFDPACRYLVQLVGDAQWDADTFRTKRDARETAKELAKIYGCKIVAI